jgi:hypothetical protein
MSDRVNRKCGFCVHIDRKKYEILYLTESMNMATIAKEIELHPTQVSRHLKSHCEITKEQAVHEVENRNTEIGTKEVLKDELDMLSYMAQMKVEHEEDVKELLLDKTLSASKRFELKLKMKTELRKLIEAMIKSFELNAEKKKQESILTNLEIVVIPDKVNKPDEKMGLDEYQLKSLVKGKRGRPRVIKE